MSILDTIIDHKKKEVKKLKSRWPLSENNYKIIKFENHFNQILEKSGISILAEVKQKSPTAGTLISNYTPVEIAEKYKKSGADAVSVVTDSEFFGGTLHYLTSIKEKVKMPVLRKDFIIDSYQLFESCNAGADCVLLIARILRKNKLRNYIKLSRELGMFSIIEVHSEAEVEKSLNCGADIIGINNRDLNSFKVNMETSLELIRLIPREVKKISESGIYDLSQVQQLFEAGFDGILVGEALLRSADPSDVIRDWKQNYRGNYDPHTISKSYVL